MPTFETENAEMSEVREKKSKHDLMFESFMISNKIGGKKIKEV